MSDQNLILKLYYLFMINYLKANMKPSENKTFFLEYEHDYCSTEYKLYLDSFSPQRIKSEEIQRRLNVRGLKLIINLG